MTLTRRFVVLASPVAFGSVIQQRRLPAQTQPATVTASAPLTTPPAASVRPPALAADLVRDYVIAGHGNLERVKTMLAEHSGLINATWDWGGGDFETALGGASHMGRRDIAEFLISQGARVDIFASAMLGNLDAVKSIAEAFPGTAKCLGPHRIPLIEHARKGGLEASAVLQYLEHHGG